MRLCAAVIAKESGWNYYNCNNRFITLHVIVTMTDNKLQELCIVVYSFQFVIHMNNNCSWMNEKIKMEVN